MPSKDNYHGFRGESINEEDSQIHLLTQTLLECHNANQQLITECQSLNSTSSDSESNNEFREDEELDVESESISIVEKFVERNQTIQEELQNVLVENEKLKLSLEKLRDAMNLSSKFQQSVNAETSTASDEENQQEESEMWQSSGRGSNKLIAFALISLTSVAIGVIAGTYLYLSQYSPQC